MNRHNLNNSPPPRAFVAVGLAGVLALAGCAAPDAPTGSNRTDSGTEAVEEVEAPTGECLIGSWFIPEDQLQSFYDAMDTPTNFDVDGGTGLVFSEDRYEYTPNFTLNMTVAGHDAAGTLVGSISGDYVSDGKQLTTTNDTSDVSMTIEVLGTTQSAGEAFNDFLGISPINSAPYQCENGAPVIMFATGEGNPRIPIRLSPTQ